MHNAAEEGHGKVCELLLENKADVAAVDNDGCAAFGEGMWRMVGGKHQAALTFCVCIGWHCR